MRENVEKVMERDSKLSDLDDDDALNPVFLIKNVLWMCIFCTFFEYLYLQFGEINKFDNVYSLAGII